MIQNNQISSTGGDGVHGNVVTGNVTLLSNSITADQGVWLKDVSGQVKIGGLGTGEGNNILALGQEGIVLAGGITGVVTLEANLINSQKAGVDFEAGLNDFTALGNDITAADGAGILTRNTNGGDIVIGDAASGDANIILASGGAYGVSIDAVQFNNISMHGGNVSVSGNDISAEVSALKVNGLDGNLSVLANSNLSSDNAADVLCAQVAGNVTIQANSLNGFGSAGVDLLDVGTRSGTSVLVGGASGLGNTVFGPQMGIAVGNAPNLTIENNDLTQTTRGIYVYSLSGTTTAAIVGNSIDRAVGWNRH